MAIHFAVKQFFKNLPVTIQDTYNIPDKLVALGEEGEKMGC